MVSCPVWELSANAAAAFGDVCAFAAFGSYLVSDSGTFGIVIGDPFGTTRITIGNFSVSASLLLGEARVFHWGEAASLGCGISAADCLVLLWISWMDWDFLIGNGAVWVSY